MQHIIVEVVGMKLQPLLYYTNDCIKKFDIVLIKLKNKECYGIVINIIEKKEYEFEIMEAKQSNYSLTDTQKILLKFISSYYMQQIGISIKIFVLRDNNISIKKHDKYTMNLNTLSNQQQLVFNKCKENNISLIFGATGSGKTEIYFHAIKECINKGQQALLLMPEISLTPQMQKRLQKAFPNLSDIWHSKRTTKQKQKTLQSLQDETTKIIAGARSALFLPYTNLGLIIIDEEHDDSYKSNSQPKYNARDLAIFLSNKGIKVILGSATPSTKSYYIAKKYNYLLHLQNRFHETQCEMIYDETNQIGPSNKIIYEIQNTLLQNKQIIVFIPTRANFKIIECIVCKHKITCPHCSISLSLHSKKNALVCHYCNFMCQIPTHCKICGNEELSGIRIGTEEFKKQLQKKLENKNINAKIEVFDRDNITTQNKLEKILKAFDNQEIDILIGTQMIAKGHDYHNVFLSIIIGIDYMLQIPDYRAYENSFSLLYQVSGRSGRKNNGKILIQTKDSQVISDLGGDYTKVLEYEIESRYNLYPPFCRLALVSFNNKDDKKAYSLAIEFKNTLEHIKTSYIKHENTESKITKNIQHVEIVGLCEASIFKVNRKYYYQILLRSHNNLALQQILSYALNISSKIIQENIDINIDPLNI